MRTHKPSRRNTVIVSVIVAAASCGLCTAGEPLMQATRDWHTGQIVVTEGKKPVLQYNYLTQQPPEGFVASVAPGNRRYARARSNYIHPLYGPHGEVLTHDWSQDHPHHRGIYWAWPEVDWRGQRGDLHALQRVFARPTGNITLQNGDTCARIEAENRWIWEDETPIVREVATFCVHRSGDHGRYIDLVFRFEALDDDVALAEEVMAGMGEYLDHPRCVAIGEIGLNNITANEETVFRAQLEICLLYTSPSPRDLSTSRMPSSA